jgi:hypothetical protein
VKHSTLPAKRDFLQANHIIEGNLFHQVDKIMDILRIKYLKAYISFEGIHRREKLERAHPLVAG